jgi:hypothetical protein
VKEVIETVSDVAVAGVLKPVTEGSVVSPVGGSVIVTVAFLLADTFPAASFAHAYSVFAPADVAVQPAGAVALHPVALANGLVALSLTR